MKESKVLGLGKPCVISERVGVWLQQLYLQCRKCVTLILSYLAALLSAYKKLVSAPLTELMAFRAVFLESSAAEGL